MRAHETKEMEMPSYLLYWIIRKTAENFPNLTAQMFREDAKQSQYSTMNFRGMFAQVRAVALGLMELGLKKGDKVGLIADVGHHWHRISLGITTVGGVDVPRGTDATEGDLAYIFRHADCGIIFLETEKVYAKIANRLDDFENLKTIVFFDQVPAGIPDKFTTLTLDELLHKGESVPDGDAKYHAAAQAVDEDDLATIIYTSGTTGDPKGVMHTQKSLAWEPVHTIRGFDVEPGGCTMGFLPPWHIAERLIEMTAMRVACAVAFTSVATLGKDLQAARPTFLLSVPRVWESFYNKVLDGVKKASPVAQAIFEASRWTAMEFSEHRDVLMGTKYTLEPESPLSEGVKTFVRLNAAAWLFVPHLVAQQVLSKVRQGLGGRVKFAISGAGALPEHIDRFFYAAGIPIIETYGMTETVGVSSRRNFPDTVIGTVGAPFPGVEIKLLDEQGNTITEPNKKGVAWHRGPHIMQGYYKNEEKTKEVLKDGWLNSGDLLVWTTNGQLKFAGRAKDTIVLFGGENVEPLPIEDALNQSEFVEQVVVVGQDRKTLGALIVPAADNVRNHFAARGKTVSDDVESWNQDKEIIALFKGEIKSRNSTAAGFKVFEKVTGFQLLPEPFQIGEEMTQTLKIKRNVVFEKHAARIDSIYSS